MKLNRQIVKDLRETLQSHLLKNMNEFEVTVGNASFDDTEVTYKLNLRIKGAESREQLLELLLDLLLREQHYS
jgi:hypothetical protein